MTQQATGEGITNQRLGATTLFTAGLPQTLHGQLYLLAYDRNRHRFDFDKLWLLGYALRAAMLTELFLSGDLLDDEGTARPVHPARQHDSVMRAVLDDVETNEPQTWAWLVAANEVVAPLSVRDDLLDLGWLCERRHRVLGIIPVTRLAPYDEDVVAGLADRVVTALRHAVAGRPADPQSLTLGLLCVLGEFPTLYNSDERELDREALSDPTAAAVPSIVGLQEAVESIYEEMQGRGGAVAGGNAGCSGCAGCGGCGG